MADHVVLVHDPVAAMHVARDARDIERLAAVVALHQADHLGRDAPLVEQAADAQHRVQAERDLGLHVRELLLHQLRRGERLAEHHPVQRVVARGVPAEFRRAQRAPGDAVARPVEAGEGTGERLHARQPVLLRHEDVLHHDHAGDGGAQRELALDLGETQALHAAFQHEAAQHALVVLGPDHGDIGDRRIGDPGLGAVEDVAAIDLLRARAHGGGIGPRIGFREAEAAHPFAGAQLRQVFLALLLGPVGVDGEHHQRGLHREGRAVAGIDALDLARHQPVGHVGDAGAAIALERGAEETHLAELVHDLAVEGLVAEGLQHAGLQLLLAELARRIADQALVFRERLVEQQRVVPDELRTGGLADDVHGGVLRHRAGRMLACRRSGNREGRARGARRGRSQAASVSGEGSGAAGRSARGRGSGISMKAGTASPKPFTAGPRSSCR